MYKEINTEKVCTKRMMRQFCFRTFLTKHLLTCDKIIIIGEITIYKIDIFEYYYSNVVYTNIHLLHH